MVGALAQILRVSEIDEHRADSGPAPAIDVAPSVAHHPGSGKVYSHDGGGIEQHARLRLAPSGRLASAGIVANLDPVDLGNQLKETLMHGLDHILGLIAPADVGLVGCDDQKESGILQAPAGFRHARKEPKLAEIRRRVGLAVPNHLDV
jgi:hypothetical protein